MLQPKPQWSAIALTKIDTYGISTSNLGVHLVGTCLIMIELELCTDLISYQVKTGLHPLCMSGSRALLVLMFDWPLSSERELIARAMATSTQKLLQSSGIQCEQTCYFEFGSTQAYLKQNEVCVAAVSLFEDYLSIWSELHIDVHEQVRQWACCFCLEKLYSSRYLACKIQDQREFYDHHILEHVVGGIRTPDKLEETVQIMDVSIQRQFLSQDKFKWSGCFARECRLAQLDDGSRARIQLTVLIRPLTVCMLAGGGEDAEHWLVKSNRVAAGGARPVRLLLPRICLQNGVLLSLEGTNGQLLFVWSTYAFEMDGVDGGDGAGRQKERRTAGSRDEGERKKDKDVRCRCYREREGRRNTVKKTRWRERERAKTVGPTGVPREKEKKTVGSKSFS